MLHTALSCTAPLTAAYAFPRPYDATRAAAPLAMRRCSRARTAREIDISSSHAQPAAHAGRANWRARRSTSCHHQCLAVTSCRSVPCCSEGNNAAFSPVVGTIQ